MENDIISPQTKQHIFGANTREIVGVVSVNSIDFIRTIFNCFQEKKIAVFLTSEQDYYKIDLTGAKKIITPKLEFGWCKIGFIPQQTESLAQIAFTSGTTGNPKGVLLSHQNLNDVVERLNHTMKVDSTIREYVGIPVNYSFGFGRCRAVATAGGEFYLPENGFNPLEIRDMLLEGSINAISAVPSLWRLLFQCQQIFGQETHQVKWIEIGSQYMSQKEKEQIKALFPNAKILQHYGLTEASRSTFLEIDQTSGIDLESVGKGYGNMQIKLSPEQKIMIKGDNVARKMLVNGELIENIDQQGWLTTNDLGKIENGYIYYQGRADDLINCGGIKISPETIEKHIRETLQIKSGVAVTRIPDVMRGDGILIATLKEYNLPLESVKKAATEAMAANNIRSFDAIKLIELDEFPTTNTGKIKRKELTKLFEAEPKIDSTAPDVDVFSTNGGNHLSEQERHIIEVWQEILGVENIEPDSNFFSIGGDSLTAISVMVKMEQLGISRDIVRGMLQGLSVRELAQRIEGSKTTTATTTTNTQHEQEQHIIKVWQEVLGVDNIEPESNFFSIGGDSLTAISVMVKMEQLGIPREIVRGMLQGLSVRELAQRIQASQNTEKEPVKISHTISNLYTKTGFNINIIRGFLVFCVISGHWSAGLFDKLPSVIGQILAPVMANIFAAGTQGFSIVYGVSAGYSLFEIYKNDRQRFYKLIKTTLKLLFVGIIALSIRVIGLQLATNRFDSFTNFTNSFYSVISYFFLITATLGLWFKLLEKVKNPVVVSLCLGVLIHFLYYFFLQGWGNYTAYGLVELFKILMVAKFGYFSLTPGVLVGMSIGIAMRKKINKEINPLNTDYIWIGLALISFALVTSSHADSFDTWWTWPRPVSSWTWIFNIGAILVLLKINDRILSQYNEFPQWLKFIFQATATIGILAFPFFITHQFVLPLKNILETFGLSNLIAIAIPMILFLVFSYFICKKVYETNFTW